jgi:predicted adenine nucleotide alpha hydrolase (AANH) superfamily ATPase
LLISFLRHVCCSPLSETIVAFLREKKNNYVWERRTTIMSERGEQ